MFDVQTIHIANATLYGFGIYVCIGFMALFAYLLYKIKYKAGFYICIILPASILIGRFVYCFARRNTVFYSDMDGSFLGLQEFFKLTKGGISIYGCLLGVLIACFLLAKIEKDSFLNMFGLLSPGIALLMMFVHYAAILGGEGFGNIAEENASAFLYVYNDYGEAYLAIFRLEALFCMVLALYLFFSHKNKKAKAISFLSLYAAMFLFFASLHRDSSLRLEANGFIRVDQLISYVILLCVLLYLLFSKKQKAFSIVLSFLLCTIFVITAEFFEKIPLPTWLLFSLSLASCINIGVLFSQKANAAFKN